MHTPIRISFDLPFVGGKVIGFLVVVGLDGRESGTFLIGLESENLVSHVRGLLGIIILIILIYVSNWRFIKVEILPQSPFSCFRLYKWLQTFKTSSNPVVAGQSKICAFQDFAL